MNICHTSLHSVSRVMSKSVVSAHCRSSHSWLLICVCCHCSNKPLQSDLKVRLQGSARCWWLVIAHVCLLQGATPAQASANASHVIPTVTPAPVPIARSATPAGGIDVLITAPVREDVQASTLASVSIAAEEVIAALSNAATSPAEQAPQENHETSHPG